MSRADGEVKGATLVHDAGPRSTRWNLVIVSEGYLEADLPQFHEDVRRFVRRFFSIKPFDEYRCAINVWRIDVTSNERGADPCSGPQVATFFDGKFCSDEAPAVDRLLTVDSGLVLEVADEFVPERHAVLVFVQSEMHGGTGDRDHPVATISTGTDDWESIAVHELGHSPFSLGDEYSYFIDFNCVGDPGDHYVYAGEDPELPNVTTVLDRETLRWGDLVAEETPLPTTRPPDFEINPPCRECNRRVIPGHENAVGAFEGGYTYHCGIYRPTRTCMMMSSTAPFCVVCERHIRANLPQIEMPACTAPVFAAAPAGFGGAITCLVKAFVYTSIIVLLALFSFIPSVRCTIKRLQYEIVNCRRGNSKPCLPL